MIRFPLERRQPPPHYREGRREIVTAMTRGTVRAIVHADAVRIARSREPLVPSGAMPREPRAIMFARTRPPPGTIAVEVATPRVQVRAIAHPDARIPRPARPIVERSPTAPGAPRTITFEKARPAPRYR